MSEEDLEREPASIWYQRMRYEREIEAYFLVKALNELKMDRKAAIEWSRKVADEKIRQWKHRKITQG